MEGPGLRRQGQGSGLEDVGIVCLKVVFSQGCRTDHTELNTGTLIRIGIGFGTLLFGDK